MAQPRIRLLLKDARRRRRRVFESLRLEREPMVSLLVNGSRVLGAAIDHNGALDRLYARLDSEGVDRSGAECIEVRVEV